MRRGEEWGSAAAGPADVEVAGADPDLARALSGAAPGALIRFTPDGGSELARALGLSGPGTGRTAVPLDALRVSGGRWAVNGVVIGVPPDRLRSWHRPVPVTVTVDGESFSARATTVVVMNGQFWRTADLSPRGHPGDGVAEVQVYAVPAGQRRAMRSRLTQGAHLPHPGITVRRGRSVTVSAGRPLPLEVDGGPAGRAETVAVEIVPGAYRLLV